MEEEKEERASIAVAVLDEARNTQIMEDRGGNKAAAVLQRYGERLAIAVLCT